MPVSVWYIKSSEVTMTVSAEVIIAGLILKNFKASLHHPGWKWLISNYLSVYFMESLWTFPAALVLWQSWCTNFSYCFLLGAQISHCAFHVEKSTALMSAVGWQTSTWYSTMWCGLHICHSGVHCKIPLCCRDIRNFLTKSNWVATSLRVPLNLSCQKDMDNQG